MHPAAPARRPAAAPDSYRGESRQPGTGTLPSVCFYTHDQIESTAGSLIRAASTVEALLADGHRVHNAFHRPADRTHMLCRLAGDGTALTWGSAVPEQMSGYDVLWVSHFWNSSALVRALSTIDEIRAANPGIAVVIDLSDLLVKDAAGKSDATETERVRRLERLLLALGDAVVFVSEAEKRAAVETYGLVPDTVHVIPSVHPPRHDLARRGFAHRKPYACMAGAIHAHNLRAWSHGLSHVWPRIRQATPGTEIHLFGAGTDKLRNRTGDHPALEGVRMLGAVDDFADSLAGYRVHLVPTVSGVGVKTKVLESLATGTPVVCSRKALEGIETQAPLAGVFVSDEPARMAAFVRRLTQDHAFWAAANRGAIETAERLCESAAIRERCRRVLGLARASAARRSNRGNLRGHVLVADLQAPGAAEALVEALCRGRGLERHPSPVSVVSARPARVPPAVSAEDLRDRDATRWCLRCEDAAFVGNPDGWPATLEDAWLILVFSDPAGWASPEGDARPPEAQIGHYVGNAESWLGTSRLRPARTILLDARAAVDPITVARLKAVLGLPVFGGEALARQAAEPGPEDGAGQPDPPDASASEPATLAHEALVAAAGWWKAFLGIEASPQSVNRP